MPTVFLRGMLWTGIAVGRVGMLFRSWCRTCRFTGTGVCGCRDTGGGGRKVGGGFFAWQTAAWGGALWLLFVMTGYFRLGETGDGMGDCRSWARWKRLPESGQYAGIWPVYSASFPVTGTFDNPAGLAACLASVSRAALYFMASRLSVRKCGADYQALSMGAAVVLSGSRTGWWQWDVWLRLLFTVSFGRSLAAWRVRAAFVSVGA